MKNVEGLHRIIKTLFALIIINEVVTIAIGIVEVIPSVSILYLSRQNLPIDWSSILLILISLWPLWKWILIGTGISIVLIVMMWIIAGFMGIKDSLFSSK